MSIFNVITLLGGLSLFLYGMRIMGDGLKSSSSETLKKLLGKATDSPFKAFLLGLAVTGLIQSSTATIVLTSGLVGAGLIGLHESVGIILGANVGTTVTGQIIRLLDINASETSLLNFFKPATLAPLAAIIGIIFIMAVKNKNAGTIGNIAMGFGILFTGLMSMTGAVTPLSESEGFRQLIISFSRTPVLGYIVGASVAFILQSSSATIGILQALSMTGALTFSSVYAIIVGVYLGDCVTTAIVCSIGAKADAKRTGIIHIIFNLCESVLVFAGVTILHKTGVLDPIWNMTMTSGTIANTHTVFNLVCAILLLPLANTFERISRKVVKDDIIIGENVDRELKLLDDKLFTSPALALSSAAEAISTMGRLAQQGVVDAMNVLEKYDRKTVEIIDSNEEHIDRLADAVDNYMIRLSPHVKPGHESEVLNFYIQSFGEFERIGDYAVNLSEEAEELIERGEKFSDSALQELEVVKEILDEITGYAYMAFKYLDYEAARHIEPVEEVVDDLVAALRNNHIRRLREGQCTVYGGLCFLDALVNIERIADQCSNIGVYALAIIDERVMLNHHDYIQELHEGNDPMYNEEFEKKHKYYFDKLETIRE